MNILLRKYAEWKGRRRAAQIIVFDGAAEIEKTQAFGRGIVIGMVLTTLLYVVMAPNGVDPVLMREIDRRAQLLQEADRRADEAMALTGLCLNTAQGMERTLDSYQQLLGR